MANAANNESICDANSATVESKKRKTTDLQGKQYREDDEWIANQKKRRHRCRRHLASLLGSGPVVPDLFQVGRALPEAETRSLVLHRAFSATQLLSDEHVRIGEIDLLQRVDFGRSPVLHATGSVETASCSCWPVPASRASGLVLSCASCPAIHPWLLSSKENGFNCTSS
jgi:hypothetical protein